MMGDETSVEAVRGPLREPARYHRVERRLVVRPQAGADDDAAGAELEALPGVANVAFGTIDGLFDVVFNPAVVSEDELAASLHHYGYDLVSWQEVQATHSDQQRTWLLAQIRSLTQRVEQEVTARGTYADGLIRGSLDGYVRAARAFGLVTDAEIVDLIPAHFLGGPR